MNFKFFSFILDNLIKHWALVYTFPFLINFKRLTMASSIKDELSELII